jgi:hypothetical protein
MIDPRQFKKAANKTPSKVVLAKDPADPTQITATYEYFDKEGAAITEVERTTLAEVQAILSETNKDRNALQDLEAAIIALG